MDRSLTKKIKPTGPVAWLHFLAVLLPVESTSRLASLLDAISDDGYFAVADCTLEPGYVPSNSLLCPQSPKILT